jgi:hypothetical protein
VLNLLAEVERHLSPLLGTRGFTPTDVSAAEHPGEMNVQLIGFRAGLPGQRLLLLDLCHLLDQQTVAVELWSPADLARMSNPETDRVAIRRRVWHYDSSDDSHMVVQAIVREVVGWIEASNSERRAT